MSEKKELVTAINVHPEKRPLNINGQIVPYKGEVEVFEHQLGKFLEKKEDSESQDETGLTNAEVIETIKATSTILNAEDHFTGAGIPKTDSLKELFNRNFTATDRDEIWEAVSELYKG